MDVGNRELYAASVMVTLFALGCGDAGIEPPSTPSEPAGEGALRVVFRTPGPTVDDDGFTVTLDGTRTLTAEANGEVLFPEVPAGSHDIEVADVAANCAFDDGVTFTRTVLAETTTTLPLSPWCVGPIPPDIAIVFVTGVEGDNRGGARGMSSTDLAGLREDGTGEVVLVEGLPVDSLLRAWAFADPAWSPDGSALAFVRHGALSEEIWLAMADGSEVRHLAAGYWPTWSPDGERLAFVDGGALFTINRDGSGMQVVDLPGPVLHAAWSPTGSKLAVSIDNPAWGPWVELGIVESDGSGLRRIGGSDEVHRGEPSWSADGTRLAYRIGDADIGWWLGVVGADGSNDRELLVPSDGSNARRPAWSAAGDQVLFSRYRVACGSNGFSACPPNLFSVRTDGSGNEVPLIQREGPAEAGTWRPTG